MSNRNNDKEKNTLLGNILKGVGTLVLASLAGSVGGKVHSNINENKRRNNADNIEKAFTTQNKGE